MQDTIDTKSISKILSEGADERLFTDATGKVKYGVSLTDYEITNRGSCTCNPIDKDDYNLLNTLLAENSTNEDWIALRDQHEITLKQSLSNQNGDDFEVFFAPSGTDLVYYPLLISLLINRAKPILNIITCLEELGSGTMLASQGKYHAEFNQFGDKVPYGEDIFPKGAVTTYFFNARSKDGEILRHDKEIAELIDKHKDHCVVVNLVFGSKSGIEDSLDLIDELKNDNILWCVDMCQFRHSKEVISSLLRKNALVMLTGSKFYQAPPFCATILAPQKIYDKIRNSAKWNETAVFNNILSKYDFPSELRENLLLTDQINVAGILRWACAMREIVLYKQIPEAHRQELIEAWNQFVTDALTKRDGFELMPDQKFTNKSIISFRLKKGNNYLTHEDLKLLHNKLANPADFGNSADNAIFIGQPVAYGNRSFLRIAIGAKNIREFQKLGSSAFDDDLRIIDAISSQLNLWHAD